MPREKKLSKLGSFLAELMEKKGINSQLNLSRKSGISIGQISKVFSGNSPLSLEIAKKIAPILSVDSAVLMKVAKKEERVKNVLSRNLLKVLAEFDSDIDFSLVQKIMTLESTFGFSLGEDSYRSIIKDYLESEEK